MSITLDRLSKIGIITKIRIISLFTLLIPVYFFTLGDFYGGGFQTPLFRYQEIFLGSFLVLISNDVYNAITGFFQGAMIPVVILWCLGSFFLVVNIVLLFLDRTEFKRMIRRSGILIIIAGFFFLFSLIVRYGPLFNNSSGIAIPLGLPLIFLIGIWMYLWKNNDENTDDTGQPVD
jgi:hypothetical protein